MGCTYAAAKCPTDWNQQPLTPPRFQRHGRARPQCRHPDASFGSVAFVEPSPASFDAFNPPRVNPDETSPRRRAISHSSQAFATRPALTAARVSPPQAANAASTASSRSASWSPDALKLLERLDLRGKIVTGDAIFCQKSIAAKIVERGGDYVFPVKDNQKTLRQDIETAFNEPVFPPVLME